MAAASHDIFRALPASRRGRGFARIRELPRGERIAIVVAGALALAVVGGSAWVIGTQIAGGVEQ